MSYVYRLEIYPNSHHLKTTTAQEEGLKNWFLKYMDVNFSQLWEIKTFLIESQTPMKDFNKNCEDVFCDKVMETIFSSESSHQDEYLNFLKERGFKNPYLIDIGFRSGVTDNSAQAALDALKLLPAFKNMNLKVSSGVMYFVESSVVVSASELEKLAYEKLANTLLQNITITTPDRLPFNERMKTIHLPHVHLINELNSYSIDLNIDEAALKKMNEDNCWAFNQNELSHIKTHFSELGRNPTDVEIEIIAQSWSEHCKHKIFSSEITYSESQLPEGVRPLGNLKIDGIFKTLIRGATKKVEEDRKIPWLISVFHDNAGVVRFDESQDICIKVETHNSPSALDPYGGALTGILGVNRDILGTGLGAKPIANTNVFCLAENNYFKNNQISLPPLLKNPDRIRDGVHQGVQDGGNKSGIPTVNGAFVFDRDFVGKPLVFCGTVGVIPQSERSATTHEKGQRAGDFIVMAGGRVGKDGIHGATFSSMELVDGIPASVVQIGDPITQKRLSDFLIEARILGLFNSVTDNGAGGLSSSVGEMAVLTNGADIQLEKVLLKYPSLSPYEIMVSESQERMTFSVPEEFLGQFLSLAEKRNVEACVIGNFTNSGFLKASFHGKIVADLSLHFLHESLPKMKLPAHFDMNSKTPHWIKKSIPKPLLPKHNLKKILLEVLRSPNVRSHEHLVRRYDHEVKGATLVKPFTGFAEKGFSAPSDAGVIWMKPHGGGADNAIAIASGICPKVSEFDTYLMAQYAVDEAVRNAVCVGANPDEMVLVDNYCWPDPIESEKNPDAKYKLAQLVRASCALYDVSTQYGMPFVSGKDSMKNDFVGLGATGEKVKISVPPTILVTAMGRVPGLKTIVTSEIKNAGNLVYLLGENLIDYHSAFELKNLYEDYEVKYPLPYLEEKKQLDIYRKLHSALKDQLIESSHDVSDGGILVSLAEKMLGTKYGIKIQLETQLVHEHNALNFLFNEGAGRILVSIKKDNQKAFEEKMAGTFYHLGETQKDEIMIVLIGEKELVRVTGDECLLSFQCEARVYV